MTDLNRCQLLGTLDSEPSSKVVGKERRELVTFMLAVTLGRGSAAHTSRFPVTAWGGLAKDALPKLVRGARVFVEGTLKTRAYDDEHGAKQWITEVDARALLVGDAKELPLPLPDLREVEQPDLAGGPIAFGADGVPEVWPF